jgi:hypothetical protein
LQVSAAVTCRTVGLGLMGLVEQPKREAININTHPILFIRSIPSLFVAVCITFLSKTLHILGRARVVNHPVGLSRYHHQGSKRSKRW